VGTVAHIAALLSEGPPVSRADLAPSATSRRVNHSSLTPIKHPADHWCGGTRRWFRHRAYTYTLLAP